MKFYQLREEDKQFLYTLLYATGIILFWRGVWEISYEIPLLENVYFAFFVGLFILTVTGYMYKEFDPFSQRMKKLNKIIHETIQQHKKGTHHTVHYYDDIAGDDHKILPHNIKKIEGDFMIVEEKGHELFIPLSRLTRIHKGKEIVWKR